MIRDRVKARKEAKKAALWDQVSGGESLSGQSDTEEEKQSQTADLKPSKKQDGFRFDIEEDDDIMVKVSGDK